MKQSIDNPARTTTMIEQIAWEDAKTELREIVREEIARVPQNKTETDRLLTRRELAKKLKISLPTLHTSTPANFPPIKSTGVFCSAMMK